MAFEELKENSKEIQNQVQAYIENSMAYYKLWGFKVAMQSTVMMLKFVLIVLALLMVVLFCSVAAAIAIGKALDSYALGFLIVGGFYVVCTALLFLIQDKVIAGQILKKFSELFFND
jgi:hypothetical protein